MTKEMQAALDALTIVQNDMTAAIEALGVVNRGELGAGRSSHAELRMAIEVMDKLRQVVEGIAHRLVERQ